MLIKIIGVLWVILAVLLLVRPEEYKAWLQKNMKNAKRYIILVPLIPGVFLILVGMQYDTVLGKIVTVIGAMGVLKAIMFLNKRIYDKLVDWALSIPTVYYRIGACVHIGIGLVLIFL